MASVFQRACKFVSTLENAFFNGFGFRPPPEHFALAYVALPETQPRKSTSEHLDELLNDFILWAVPKKRRTVEKRRMRKFGVRKWVWKMIEPRTNILICGKCGGYHEAGRLCKACYDRIKAETEEMQERIQAELGLSPVEEDVVVLYAGEKEKNPEFWKGKRIIEMPKERPPLFGKNLLQRTTQPLATTKEVKPDELG